MVNPVSVVQRQLSIFSRGFGRVDVENIFIATRCLLQMPRAIKPLLVLACVGDHITTQYSFSYIRPDTPSSFRITY
jgi:hypothetical protein